MQSLISSRIDNCKYTLAFYFKRPCLAIFPYHFWNILNGFQLFHSNLQNIDTEDISYKCSKQAMLSASVGGSALKIFEFHFLFDGLFGKRRKQRRLRFGQETMMIKQGIGV